MTRKQRSDGSPAKEYKHVSLTMETANALAQLQAKLAVKLGFKPTFSQTVSWLLGYHEGSEGRNEP